MSAFLDRIASASSRLASTGNLQDYNEKANGPLLGVSDEGSAADVIATAAYDSAKAKASDRPNAQIVGIIIDGERMTSAGEVPIGPDEYQSIITAASTKTFCTTNVGVRLNARLYQPLTEFRVALAADNYDRWVESVFSAFQRFIDTPDGIPRPLTVRLLVAADDSEVMIRKLVSAIEQGRLDGRLGMPDLHRITLLLDFDDQVATEEHFERIEWALNLASEIGIPEVAIDGDKVQAARGRLSVQGILNVLGPDAAKRLLRAAKSVGVALAYRYHLDPESGSRTIWTGLFTARANGLNGAKYGLVPLAFETQRDVVEDIHAWFPDWTAIPAFYADTPFLSEDGVSLSDSAEGSLRKWLDMASRAGARVVLVDCPDRITPRIDSKNQQRPRRLLKSDGSADDRGIFSMGQIGALVEYARERSVKVLWSGGIRPHHAIELGRLGVFGIFTTSSTARPIPVGDVLAGDWQLAAENEPSPQGVRRVHALLQAGFLMGALKSKRTALCKEIEELADPLVDVPTTSDEFTHVLGRLNEVLVQGWRAHWS